MAPVVEAARQFGRHRTEVALVRRRIADQVPGRFVDGQDVVGIVDQDDAGLHAPDDEVVDLLEVEQVDAALLGKRLGLAHLPAEVRAQARHGEVGDAEKHRFDHVALAGAAEREQRRGDDADRGEHGEQHRLAERQQQRPDADVDQQHHRDRGVTADQRHSTPRRDVDGQGEADAGGDMPAHAVGRDQQHQGDGEIGDGDAAAEQRVADLDPVEGERVEHEAGVDDRLEHAVEVEEIQLASRDVAGFAGRTAHLLVGQEHSSAVTQYRPADSCRHRCSSRQARPLCFLQLKGGVEMRHSKLRAFVLLTAMAALPAWAVPAHYVVFGFDAQGRIEARFHATVELAADTAAAVAPSLPGHLDGRLGWRAVKDGGRSERREVEVSSVLRAEFARDPSMATADRAACRRSRPAFVLRVPLAEAEAVEFETAAGRSADLTALARGRSPAHGAGAGADRGGQRAGRSRRRSGQPGRPAGPRRWLRQPGSDVQQPCQCAGNRHFRCQSVQRTPISSTGAAAIARRSREPTIRPTRPAAPRPPGADAAARTTVPPALSSSPRSTAATARTRSTAADGEFWAAHCGRGVPGLGQDPRRRQRSAYGGAGGSYAVTSANAQAALIVIHEYGHSFHRLADEYTTAYPVSRPAATSAPAELRSQCHQPDRSGADQWRSWFTPGIATRPGRHARYRLFEGALPPAACTGRPTTVARCAASAPVSSVCRQEYGSTYCGFGTPAGGIDPIEPGSESPSPATPVVVATGTPRTFTATIPCPVIESSPCSGTSRHADSRGDRRIPPLSQAAAPAVRTLELRATDTPRGPRADGRRPDHPHAQLDDQIDADRLFQHGFE